MKTFFFLFIYVTLWGLFLFCLPGETKPVKLVDAVYEIGYNNITLEKACKIETQMEQLFGDACYITMDVKDARQNSNIK